MNTLIIYMAKAAVYMTAFYLVYSLLLSRDTMHSRNRSFILFSIVSALILPLVTLQIKSPVSFPFFGKILSEVFISGTRSNTIQLSEYGSVLPVARLISVIYMAGIILFGLKALVNLFVLIFMIIRRRNGENNIIVFNEFNTSGFSANGYVFINSRLSPDEAEEIIRHEQNHLDHNHFTDIMIAETVKIFQWFNPVIHLFERSLRAVHEFQADEGCLKAGIPVVSYQRLLLNQVFRSKIFGLANCFSNPSLIRRRIMMMTKKRSKATANLKLIFALPVIAILLAAFSSGTENLKGGRLPTLPDGSNLNEEFINNAGINNISGSENTNTEPLTVAEEMPVFPGGDNALLRYIAENTVYPDNAKARNIQGRVIVRFAITTEGTVSMATILKGAAPDLDNEALRVVESLPKFKPGKQNGKTVPVWYMVPITFTLK